MRCSLFLPTSVYWWYAKKDHLCSIVHRLIVSRLFMYHEIGWRRFFVSSKVKTYWKGKRKRYSGFSMILYITLLKISREFKENANSKRPVTDANLICHIRFYGQFSKLQNFLILMTLLCDSSHKLTSYLNLWWNQQNRPNYDC